MGDPFYGEIARASAGRGALVGKTASVKNASGTTYVYTWRGTDTDLIPLGNTINVQGGRVSEVRLTPDGEYSPWYTLTATVIQGQIVTLFEYDPVYNELELWLLPKVQVQVAKITDPFISGTLQGFVNAIASGSIPNILDSDWTAAALSGSAPSSSDPTGGTPANYKKFLTWWIGKYAPGVSVQVILGLIGCLSRGSTKWRSETICITRIQSGPVWSTDYQVEQDAVGMLMRTSTFLARNPTLPPSYSDELNTLYANGFWLGSGPQSSMLNLQQLTWRQSYTYYDTYDPFIFDAPL